MRPRLPPPRLVALLLGLCGVVGSTAADTLIAAGQWRTGDGLPLDSVSALALDSHGYLWVGTTDGLARFDGQRFQTFRRDATPTLPENRIARLHALADGSLIVHLESEEFGRFSVREGYRPLGRTGREQLVSAGNEVWYVAPSGLGHWQPSGEPRIALPLDVTALARESAAAGSTEAPSLLLGTRSGRLLRYRPHRGELTELASAGDSEPILSIASGPDEDIAFASAASGDRRRPAVWAGSPWLMPSQRRRLWPGAPKVLCSIPCRAAWVSTAGRCSTAAGCCRSVTRQHAASAPPGSAWSTPQGGAGSTTGAGLPAMASRCSPVNR